MNFQMFASSLPNPILSPFHTQTKIFNPLSNPPLLFRPSQFSSFSPTHKSNLRGSPFVTRFGFKPEFFPDPFDHSFVIKDLITKVESFVITVADAAVSTSDAIDSVAKQNTSTNNDWLSGITSYMETVLKVLQNGLSTLHVPYAYGFAIILLTVLVKAATFPLTKKQVESAMAMRSMQPQVKAIQEKYAGNQEKIQLETARLYKVAGINPFAGCLPTLLTIPVWIGLYRALSNVADEGLLTEGFFWIPSLAGPTTIASRQNGSGISWLFPFVDGHPPLGWPDTFAYLVLPVLLVISQYISVQIMQSTQSNDLNTKSSQAITQFLPLMIGYFALSVPSGLSLYWLTNNILSMGQQVWLQKLGGAKNPVSQEDQLHVQKSVSELDSAKESSSVLTESSSVLDSTKTKAVQSEQLTPDGLQPGERFKQLKEQEAKRRQQREEEKRKAEEAAALSGQTANGNLLSTPGRENGSSMSGSSVVDDKSVRIVHDFSAAGVGVKGEDSDFDASGKEELQSYEDKQKIIVEVHDSMTITDRKLPEEEAHQDRRE